ncbi:MAG: GNAT family N-acetyltransferase [Myxococcota bacterium]|nr:GNAT family N-acetyltransferase [Myxococcota bacterium]
MFRTEDKSTRVTLSSPEDVLARIEPGMSIFLGTGAAEPRTLVRHLMACQDKNLDDLTLIQLVSLGDAFSLKELTVQRYRLKTFFSGWVVSQAISEGRVDLIPSRFSSIPRLISSGRIPIDVAIVQITPPSQAGYASLGIAVDAARQAMEQASLVVGEINPHIPFTIGDTAVPISEFDMFIRSKEPPYYLDRWPLTDIFDKLAANVASVIDDRDCLALSMGPLFEGLAKHLKDKQHLGIHSPFFTDPMMDLVKSGAVTNRYKNVFKGKSLVSYAIGSKELMSWLNHNPLVEFQGIDKVFSPLEIGRNRRFVPIVPARKIDLSGQIALHFDHSNMGAGPGEAVDFFNGAEISPGGRTIVALTSRNRSGDPNILISASDEPNILGLRAPVDMVATEYGVARLRGRTVRERAQALIDIAHPDDRLSLVENAKKKNILYSDQIFLSDSALFYPAEIEHKHDFGNGLTVRFRAIKPSDEEDMRQLFYRFSNETVYYRYFSPIKTMPHAKMQAYVNVDYRDTLSIVGLMDDSIIAEGRFVKDINRPFADMAFVVDERFQGRGLASFMLQMLIKLAKERGIKGFTADVLASNKGMMKVIEKVGLPASAKLQEGVYRLTIPFDAERRA